VSFKNSLRQAINERQLISFGYKKHPRIAEPYHYGIYAQQGNVCYQIAGSSSSGKQIGFKAMSLNKIKNLTINKEENFMVRRDYNPQDKRWKIEYGVNKT